jgi:glycosyltransferase involved in cell wall biosynthesis
MNRPVILVLGPHREAVSGVSTHLSLLFASRLAEEFSLTHFQVGSEGRSEGRIGRWLRLALSPLALAAAVLARGAALVHLNTSLNARAYWRDLAYLMVAKLCGARVLYQVHGGALPLQFARAGRLHAAFLRWTLQLPDAVVVLARTEFEAYRGFVPSQQVILLPNGIDCAPYAHLSRPRPKEVLRLAYVGRLAREKGLYETLQGLRQARTQGAQARLVIAGSGPEEAGLRYFAAQLGLAGDVVFPGPVTQTDKLELLGETDVLVLASYSEGLPYALLEGMAAGAAVIATRVGGMPDVVLDGVHGLLVPPRDADALGRAFVRLAADRELLARMGAACRRRIVGGYSLERSSQELDGLYSELCAE